MFSCELSLPRFHYDNLAVLTEDDRKLLADVLPLIQRYEQEGRAHDASQQLRSIITSSSSSSVVSSAADSMAASCYSSAFPTPFSSQPPSARASPVPFQSFALSAAPPPPAAALVISENDAMTAMKTAAAASFSKPLQASKQLVLMLRQILLVLHYRKMTDPESTMQLVWICCPPPPASASSLTPAQSIADSLLDIKQRALRAKLKQLIQSNTIFDWDSFRLLGMVGNASVGDGESDVIGKTSSSSSSSAATTQKFLLLFTAFSLLCHRGVLEKFAIQPDLVVRSLCALESSYSENEAVTFHCALHGVPSFYLRLSPCYFCCNSFLFCVFL